MRLSVPFLAACLLVAAPIASPAGAQQISPMTGTTAGADAATPAAPVAPGGAGRRAHMSMQQRFEAANTGHDGKLTLAQAQAGHMRAVARDFDSIDTAKRGYVTMDDIRAYNRARRAARHAAAAKPQ